MTHRTHLLQVPRGGQPQHHDRQGVGLKRVIQVHNERVLARREGLFLEIGAPGVVLEALQQT
jgi:hypothetical protein